VTGGFSASVDYSQAMVQNVAPMMVDLEQEDFNLLSGVEQGMRFSEWVQRGKLPDFSGLTAENVTYRLDRVLDRGLIERKTIQYEGYKLTPEGYDALALHTFAERDTVQGFGSSLGVGKESDVYEVQAYKPMALKYHREGYTNFREVMKERDYTSDNDHVSWLYTARKAAEREYERLETMYPDVSVPRPVDHNRHAIVMEKMAGVELARTRVDSEQVLGVLDLVLREMSGAYDAGFVHADVSEYNVFLAESGVTLFDWPQAVPADHENALEFLARDVDNIVGYFQRKYPSDVSALDRGAVVDALVAGEFETVREHVA
jgi:RIO kinase 2